MKIELTKDDIDSILKWYDCVVNDFGHDCMSKEEIELKNNLEKLMNQEDL